jgi:hypothetical protein
LNRLGRLGSVGALRIAGPRRRSKIKEEGLLPNLTFRMGAMAVAAVALLIVSAALTAALTAGDGSKSSASTARLAAGKLSAETLAGNRGEPNGSGKATEGPATAEAEEYAHRAYPGDEIPLTASLEAKAAFEKVKARGVGSGRNTPGQWVNIGPSHADYPGVLSFTGADYTASGRITALAISPTCDPGSKCRLWLGAAGGGIWRTDNAMSGSPSWTYLSGDFGTNAIGTLTYANGVLYAGTGESHASGDSAAGLGIWKSTDGGDSWTKLPSLVTNLTTSSCGANNAAGQCVLLVPNGTYTGDAFAGRSISSIVVDPNNPSVIYVGSARGVRGVSSVTGGGSSNPPTPRPPFGLFKSTDGGQTFSYIWDGNLSVRGVTRIALDPSNSNMVYASAYGQGVWRSANGGGTFAQIKSALNPAANTDRAEFAVNTLPNGNTRMYVGIGNQSAPAARFYRTDDAANVALNAFTDLTTSQVIDYCTGQCWYDNVVYSPAGHPDVVYVGGSYQYGEYWNVSNSRGLLYSTDAGASFTDVSYDATIRPVPPGNCCNPTSNAPNGMHPDHQVLVTHPNNPGIFFDGSDGGLMRSSGDYTNTSSQCASRGLSGGGLALCQQLLSRIPTQLYNLNKQLSTLQFQSLSVNPFDAKNLMGGTQDNGTFETTGSSVVWPQIVYGDGGQSGFNAANPALRFNSFFGQFHDANFQNGDPTKWVIIGGPIAASPEGSNFYAPIIADPNPAAAGSIFQGSQSVWRTQDWGGDQAFLEANCPEFTTSGANPACGDFVRIGPSGATDLTVSNADYRGTTRAGGFVAAIERTKSDTGTMWVATNAGRVFISKNANAAAGSVTYTRLDTLPSATADPGRFVSGISIDPSNANHAWISYLGYDFNTPAQPGHVFEVTYDPGTNDATWTRIDSGAGGLTDLPATDVAFDDVTGDVYASSDFGVMRLPSGSSTWVLGGAGLPQVEVAGLTIVPSARKLYAATHGRSAFGLTLP